MSGADRFDQPYLCLPMPSGAMRLSGRSGSEHEMSVVGCRAAAITGVMRGVAMWIRLQRRSLSLYCP
jgi:hypothetical protein